MDQGTIQVKIYGKLYAYITYDVKRGMIGITKERFQQYWNGEVLERSFKNVAGDLMGSEK